MDYDIILLRIIRLKFYDITAGIGTMLFITYNNGSQPP